MVHYTCDICKLRFESPDDKTDGMFTLVVEFAAEEDRCRDFSYEHIHFKCGVRELSRMKGGWPVSVLHGFRNFIFKKL